ncbi:MULTISPECIES: flavoprotein [unclassified Streptomyces]|uniref:flavoprotein n=1 Tax=unclassified Streptomyces TaxID=2593676 RepID=UPI0033B0B765
MESRRCAPDWWSRPWALGWQVAVTLTPNAGRWLRANGEFDRLEALTGLPVRDTPRLPTEPRPHPVADCHIVAPASANYVAKLATGIADNQAGRVSDLRSHHRSTPRPAAELSAVVSVGHR